MRGGVGSGSGEWSLDRCWRAALSGCGIALAACTGAARTGGPGVTPDLPPPPIAREMRGLWVATVRNIDWPSRPGLAEAEQRAELLDIMDRAERAGFNTIVFHVRPAADALYESPLEPWGAMLTGTQGRDPGWDPLAVAIEEAHARGMELHAWINPFRAGVTADSLVLAPNHVFNARRELVHVYGTQLWLDPGEPAVHDHSIAVVRDLVARYDIDAIHADDYFYPYPQNDGAARPIAFPDSASHARSGSALSREDWRRENVDRFIARMYREVHEVKPMVKVGISPFGIWRPGFPAGTCCFDAYASIYADARRWLREGSVDYLAPQLYWAIAAPQQSFPALLDWWLAENPMGRHIWPGLATYRVNDGSPNAFGPGEIPDQIRLIRDRSAPPGYIVFNTTTTLKRNGGAVASVIAPLNATVAISPAYTWLDAEPPPAPLVAVSGRAIAMTPGSGDPPRWWVVRARTNGRWMTRVLFGDRDGLTLDAEPDRVLVNAIDRAGNESAPASWSAVPEP